MTYAYYRTIRLGRAVECSWSTKCEEDKSVRVTDTVTTYGVCLTLFKQLFHLERKARLLLGGYVIQLPDRIDEQGRLQLFWILIIWCSVH